MDKTHVQVARTSRLSGALFLSIAQAILLALGYVTHILVGKIGGPSLYGVYGVVLSFLTILNLLLTLGIPVAVSKHVAEDEENSGGILAAGIRGQLLLAALLSAGTLLLARLIALLLGDPSLAPIIAFTAVIYPLTALYALFANYFNGLHAFGIQAAIIAFYAILKLTGSVGLLFYFRVYGAMAGFGVGAAAAAVAGFFLAWPSLRDHSIRPVRALSLLSFAGAFVGTPFALQILMSLDLFMVKGILHNNFQAGLYNAASTLSNIPYFILQALGFIFLPSVARLMKHEPARVPAFLRDIFRYLYLLILPGTVLLSMSSQQLLHLFFSRQFEPGAVPLMLLMVAMRLLAVFYLLTTIVAGTGHTRVPLVASWLLLPVSLLVGFTLIPHFGLIGAALATTTASTVGAVVIIAYAYYQLRITLPLATFIKGLIATVLTAIPAYFILPIGRPFTISVKYIFLAAFYVGCLYVLKELRSSD